MKLGHYIRIKTEGRVYKLTAVSLFVHLHPNKGPQTGLDLTLELPIEGGHTVRRFYEGKLSEERADELISRLTELAQEFSRYTGPES